MKLKKEKVELLKENKKLDIIADLVEAKAKTVAEAVEIIRGLKIEPK